MASWRKAGHGEASVPVEMRFVDMFMAALGALLFMAMLFVFLIANVGLTNTARPASPPAGEMKLEVITKSLPIGRAEEPYTLAVAVRGGSGIVSWKIDGGVLPGVDFNSTTGVLSGVPNAPGIGRFIVTATDARSMPDGSPQIASQPLELTVEQAKPKARDVEKWLAGAMLIAMVAFWLLLRVGVASTSRSLAQLRAAYDSGETEYYRSSGQGKTERVELPTGIYSEEAQLAFLRKLSRIIAVVVLGFAGWLAYRLWVG